MLVRSAGAPQQTSLHLTDSGFREGDATAVNMFICILINENTGREGGAPAEPFSPL